MSSTDGTAPAHRGSLQAEIHQTRPFQSVAQEALLSVQRTASLVQRHLARVLDPHGLSTAQYNVLRILRGAGPDGLPTLTIRDRMIDPAAAITRLVDRLERAGWVRRERVHGDRRTVRCCVTPAGLELLDRLDPLIMAAERELAQDLEPEALRALVDLLARLRERAAASCPQAVPGSRIA